MQLTGFERAVTVLERPKPRLQLLNKVENVHLVLIILSVLFDYL